MWHASIAALDIVRQCTVPTAELNPTVVMSLARTAKQLIAGVGQIPSAVELFPVAVHYRRALTDAEYARLPAAWCAIPAVHQAGRGLVLEENT